MPLRGPTICVSLIAQSLHTSLVGWCHSSISLCVSLSGKHGQLVSLAAARGRSCVYLVSVIYRKTAAFSAWRKRVGVEPTIRPAKDRITGFEGRESHRTLFASEARIPSQQRT